MRILVTDGSQRAALAITRSLGRVGHEVIVAESEVPNLTSRSAYCSGTLVYASPSDDPEAFVDSLERGLESLRSCLASKLPVATQSMGNGANRFG